MPCREKIIKELLDEGLTIGMIENIFNKIERRFYPQGIRPLDIASGADIKAYEKKLDAMTPDKRWAEVTKQAFAEELNDKRELLRQAYIDAQVILKGDEFLKRTTNINQRTGLGRFSDVLQKGRSATLKEVSHVKAVKRYIAGNVWGTHDELTLQSRFKGILRYENERLYAALDKYAGFLGYKVTDENVMNLIREFDNPGSTKDEAAKSLIKELNAYDERTRQRMNEAGADIKKLPDRFIMQIWSPRGLKTFGLSNAEKFKLLKSANQAEKNVIYEKARENFINEALKSWNRDKYLDRDGKPMEDEEFIDVANGIYDTIRTRGLSTPPDKQGGALGPQKSLASKLGEHREMHFKSLEDWYEFNKRAGQYDIFGIIQKSIIANARHLALLEHFGPNMQRNFQTLLATAEHYDARAGINYKKGSASVRHIFAELTGASHLPVSENGEMIANIDQGVRHWIVASKLGKLLLSQFSDTAIYSVIVRSNGLGMGDAIELAAKSLKGLSKADKEDAGMLYFASSVALNDTAMRYGESVQGVSLASKMATMTLKLGFAEHWNNGFKRGLEALIGAELAKRQHIEYSAIEPRFKNALSRYGIHEAEWNILRQVEAAEAFGKKVITPTSFKLLQETSSDVAVQRQIREAGIKVAAMMSEEADTAIVTPGAREMALLRRGTQPGTLWGEAARSFALFKTFGVSLITKVIPRIMAVEGTNGFRAGLAVQYAIGMMIAGGFTYQMKLITDGKNPRDITTIPFWVAAGLQSGGFGILGDHIFADFNRFGHDIISSLAGPVGSLASDTVKLTLGNVQQAIKGEDTHIGAKAMSYARYNVLGVLNNWYTGAALSHLVFYNLQEAANPGYLRRMRDRVEREQKTTFWWDPQDTLPEEAPNLGAMTGEK